MIRFGIIGAANIADKFCAAARMVEDVSLCAVAGKSPARTEACAQRNHIPAWYADYAEMLEREQPDAVYIATTNNFHYENLLLCIERGIPVLCEKPLVMTGAQAADIFARAREKGVFVMEAMWSRFLPGYQRALRWIDEGAIGDLRSAHYEVGFPAHEGHRVLNPALGGGALYDIGVYAIEGLTGLIRRPLTDMTSLLRRSESGVDLTAHFILEFEGCLASARCSVETRILTHASINGTLGSIVIPDTNMRAKEAFLHRADGSTEHFSQPFENGFQFEIAHFVQCLRDKLPESPVIPVRDTIQCAEIIDRCLRGAVSETVL